MSCLRVLFSCARFFLFEREFACEKLVEERNDYARASLMMSMSTTENYDIRDSERWNVFSCLVVKNNRAVEQVVQVP